MKKRILIGSIAAGITFIYACGDGSSDDATEHKGNETFDKQEQNDAYNSGNTSLDTTQAAATDHTTTQEAQTATEQQGKVNNDPNGVNKAK